MRELCHTYLKYWGVELPIFQCSPGVLCDFLGGISHQQWMMMQAHKLICSITQVLTTPWCFRSLEEKKSNLECEGISKYYNWFYVEIGCFLLSSDATIVYLWKKDGVEYEDSSKGERVCGMFEDCSYMSSISLVWLLIQWSGWRIPTRYWILSCYTLMKQCLIIGIMIWKHSWNEDHDFIREIFLCNSFFYSPISGSMKDIYKHIHVYSFVTPSFIVSS